MPLTREAKQQQVDELREKFEKAVSTVLVDYRGVDVETITELRERFRKAGIEYKVVKNNLVRKALADSEVGKVLDGHLTGMTGLAWSYEDPSSAAKIIRDFRKDKAEVLKKKDQPEKLVPKCAVIATEFIEGENVETQLASLPGKDEIRAMLLAQLMAPMQQLVMQLNAPAQRMALVVEAWRRKQEEGA